MGKREASAMSVPLVTVTPEVPKIAIHSEVKAGYAMVEIPLGDEAGVDIRNVHIRLTGKQAAAYRRLRAGLVTLAERLDDGRLVDDSIRGQPLQWLLERIAEAV